MSTFKLSKTTTTDDALAHFIENAGETGAFEKAVAKLNRNREQEREWRLDAFATLSTIGRRLIEEDRKASEVRTLLQAGWIGTGKSLADAKVWTRMLLLSFGIGTNAAGDSFGDRVPTNSQKAFREFLRGFSSDVELREFFGVAEFSKKKDADPKDGDDAGTDAGTDAGDAGTGDTEKTDAELLADLNQAILATGRRLSRKLSHNEATALRLALIEAGLVTMPETGGVKRNAA